MLSWLWVNPDGALSCGANTCGVIHGRWLDWNVARPHELAELAALATARHETLRCQCGAVEYDPASRTVREARDGDTQ